MFFLFFHGAFAERLPPRGQVALCGHGLVRGKWSGLRLAIAHARRVRLVLRRSRHGRQAAEGCSSSGAEYRGRRMIAARCGVEAIQGGPVEWACRRHWDGATVTSQRSERKNGRPAGLAVVQHEVRTVCRATLQRAAVRELCGACGRAVGGSWFNTGSWTTRRGSSSGSG